MNTGAMTRSVAGKRVLVTAGASGIGRAIAIAFADEGAKVCFCDVDEAALGILHDAPSEIAGFACDVSSPTEVARLFDAVQDSLGGLDCLINNAGISGPTARIDDITWDDWQRSMTVNVGSMLLTVQAALPLLREAGGGAIVNISTSSVRTGLVNRLPYVTSKAAVHGFTLNVARELGPEAISCNAILPGSVDNPRGNRLFQQYADEHGISFDAAVDEGLRYVSMRTMIDMNEIAAMCLHLASPAGRHISGQFIGVCGNSEWE